ncbi:hypothetical protein [Sphingobium sp.]|uniref:hypothetical protein n=1 Tax=Sphingobium sp. TaxID=1912891 RepID=UPI00257AC766|nr:hypothetical protein [Sphingobium sp.]
MRNQLQRAVIALAQPAAIQLSLFPDFVCKADELALDFESGLDALVGYEHEISAEQRAAIEALDQLLFSMSGEKYAYFWTDEAVLTDPTWEAIRALARSAALIFSWDLSHVSPSDSVYVPGGK